MSKLFRTVSLLFVFLLACAGSVEADIHEIPEEETAIAGKDNAHSSLSQSEQIRFQFLNRSGEHLVSSLNNSPFPPSKNSHSEFTSSANAVEHILQYNARLCLSQNRLISLSLTGVDVIFPFHCFW